MRSGWMLILAAPTYTLTKYLLAGVDAVEALLDQVPEFTHVAGPNQTDYAHLIKNKVSYRLGKLSKSQSSITKCPAPHYYLVLSLDRWAHFGALLRAKMTAARIQPSWIKAIPSTSPRATTPSRLTIACSRRYATHSSSGGPSSGTTRKQITVASDDGRIRWGELSRREKAARATQQSANFLVILAGVVMTGAVFTFLYTDVFAPDSKTRTFNRVVDRIKDDPKCIEALGNPKEIRAYGEASWNKWTRNRPIATTLERDRLGNEHIKMHFNVTGPLNDGVVRVHLIKARDEGEYKYHLLALDVAGHKRIFLENAAAEANLAKKTASKIFGMQWR
ncbi:mitochondrial import inner membrane translocase subunit tim21 [Ophidiomyces ophidiicola]|nr:mitochondrial import inner membrane translocase subunit tim21 [Ophidiomyces ophidiicola]KAI1914882.1 mitochondrial import inner membrane translocase subunit tim21 [Ophidiomyces ophidiicola]KAI1924790.1 mitochondrial import inner membrane translocase subunit tim21 [Ophidiomyces ophidiicola]KAI1953187.1 mitochondrial import inner membrane translocase subunit tim21 [Ophidiomyces ophidiicola]KAI2009778.1 mitochondrial import inner membrane translocase subunit tim21 [Ophidiomyces ophidiicola]